MKGEIFSEENLIMLRPAGGMHPVDYWKLLNKKSSKNYIKGDMINE